MRWPRSVVDRGEVTIRIQRVLTVGPPAGPVEATAFDDAAPSDRRNGTVDSVGPRPVPTSRQRVSAASLLMLVNGALAGVASVYATTRSVVITLIAGVIGVLVALLAMVFGHCDDAN